MRIVITGATGFIGSYLAALFLREGAEVFALSRPDSPNLKALPVHENLHIVPWSMYRAGDCVSQIGSADAFFHFAWGGVNRQEIDSPEVQAKNVAGSLECIRAAKALSCSVFMDAGSRVVFGATCSRYSDGVMPFSCLKVRETFLMSEKPSSAAASDTLSPSHSNCIIFSMRVWMM